MLRSVLFVAVAVVGTAGFATAVLAEDNGGAPPNCPGGNLKGTFKCTGMPPNQTCTEGAPWTCELTKDKDPPKAELGGGNGSGHHRFNFGNVMSGGTMTMNGGNTNGGHKNKNLMFEGGTKLRLR